MCLGSAVGGGGRQGGDFFMFLYIFILYFFWQGGDFLCFFIFLLYIFYGKVEIFLCFFIFLLYSFYGKVEIFLYFFIFLYIFYGKVEMTQIGATISRQQGGWEEGEWGETFLSTVLPPSAARDSALFRSLGLFR